MRLINGKPLMYYCINTAKDCKEITDIVVTSEDVEILEYAQDFNVHSLRRDEALSGDDVPLDPVVFDAVERIESKLNKSYDYVITLQPTSPRLTSSSLSKAIEALINSDCDTIISAFNRPHLSWRTEQDSMLPNYTERLNRQELPAHFVEAGAFVISKRECVQKNSRIGQNVSIYELSSCEGVDINTVEEWSLCESIMKRKKIVFRTDGSRTMGMGHIYRSLTLAYALSGHEVFFICSKEFSEGVEKIKSSYFNYYVIESSSDLYGILRDLQPDILVLDILDTNKSDVKELKGYAKRLIVFEDRGSGTDEADAVINALFNDKDTRPHVYTGYRYADLRDEFLLKEPKEFSNEVKNVFIMFGGSDPANFTLKVYRMICKYHKSFQGITFNIITGLAYDALSNNVVDDPEKGIFVHSDTHKVSWFMQQADVAFSSLGRGTFELASLAVPTIAMAQNDKEKTHSFVSLENGFVNLGDGLEATEETLYNTLRWLIDTPQVRKEMRELMLKLDIRQGVNRIKRIILDEMI